MEAEREQQYPMRCCCRMKYGHGLDSCPDLTSGPDEPICRKCVENKHPQSEFFHPIIKTGVRHG